MSSLFDQPFEEEDDQRDEPPPARRVFSVTELNVTIRDHLEAGFFEVWVEGELSNCRPWNTGHLYFTLKDRSSQIRGVIFRSALRYLRFKPEDGLRVIARGRVSVYEPKGEYQLVCEHLEPQGFGARQLAFEQLRARLQAEGLFDTSRKRALPALPRRIGIVTSLDGAALHDIINILTRRYGNPQIVIRPARVQGDNAADAISYGIDAIGRIDDVDVIIVGRGGGSIEDLWAFNEEAVARAIARSPVPVISAVGHETDVTIADFVADVRAATPSAAAEMVVAAKDELRGRIDRLEGRLRSAAHGRLQSLARRVHQLAARPGLAGWPGRLAMRGRHAAELSHALATSIRQRLSTDDRQARELRRRLEASGIGSRLSSVRTRLVSAEARLRELIVRRQHQADGRLQGLAARLVTLSPLAVLARGYAVCWDNGRTAVLRDASAAPPGSRVRVTLHRGELVCEVQRQDE
ncbi:MAG: exodeoxyribonuclease VII large subunit [Vicinamibacterales bacterium]